MRHFAARSLVPGALALALAACGSTTGSAPIVADDAAQDGALADSAGTDAVAEPDGTAVDAPDGAFPDVAAEIAPDVNPDADVPDVASDSDITAPSNCGGKTSVACPSGQFCATPDGQCGAIGHCASEPQLCPALAMLVCGCDGKTYGNSCNANSVGVSVNTTGACSSPSSCGGPADILCNSGQFCELLSCGSSAFGNCLASPVGCPKNLSPVCGCDGVTYGNDCLRQVAGVGKASDGSCPAAGACTIGVASSCGANQLCRAATTGTCSGTGSCVGIPTPCPMIVLPVCGCDGNTYNNGCEANNAGTNVASNGKCGSTTGCTTTKDCPSGLSCKSGTCGTCPGIMCTAIACPQGQIKDQCCNCYTP